MKTCCRHKKGECQFAVNPQPLENFSKDKKRPDGLTLHCKSCLKNYREINKDQRNETIRKWRLAHPEKMKEYRFKNREKNAKRAREWLQKNPGYKKMKLYGLTQDRWNEMFTKQNGCCAICGVHTSTIVRGLHVDHCHSTQKIRGLLCDNCNRGLGMFKDSGPILKKAMEYINN